MAVVGYARTSTVDQTVGLADQVRELEKAGCTKFYTEQVSGVEAKRPQLEAALHYLREGDVFVVTKPDRLGRSTSNLLQVVQDLTKRSISVRILSMNVDTDTATGKLMLTMLAAVATFERELMLERQRAGVAAAKALGKYKGRVPTARRQASEVKALDEAGVPRAEIAKRLQIGRASVYRILSEPVAV